MVQGVDEARVAFRYAAEKLDGIRAAAPFAAPVAMPPRRCAHFKGDTGLTQAKLCVLFRTGDQLTASVSILRVATMSVLSGSATSRLFRNVREKRSLCYCRFCRPARHGVR